MGIATDARTCKQRIRLLLPGQVVWTNKQKAGGNLWLVAQVALMLVCFCWLEIKRKVY